ncbi:unannotated protein [freshwater metagenome]|uniref:Unannotated protein n=1 Tax=freshwater metagenome TaxID=449393 RepID=A0A6J7P9T2_9ZZZZ
MPAKTHDLLHGRDSGRPHGTDREQGVAKPPRRAGAQRHRGVTPVGPAPDDCRPRGQPIFECHQVQLKDSLGIGELLGGESARGTAGTEQGHIDVGGHNHVDSGKQQPHGREVN